MPDMPHGSMTGAVNQAQECKRPSGEETAIHLLMDTLRSLLLYDMNLASPEELPKKCRAGFPTFGI